MPEPTQISFTHKEVVAALIKEHGIQEGIWGIYVKFGIRAMNVGVSDDDLQPSAIVPVLTIGLQRVEKLNNLSVDAAEVNPRQPKQKLIGAGKTKAAQKRREKQTP